MKNGLPEIGVRWRFDGNWMGSKETVRQRLQKLSNNASESILFLAIIFIT